MTLYKFDYYYYYNYIKVSSAYQVLTRKVSWHRPCGHRRKHTVITAALRENEYEWTAYSWHWQGSWQNSARAWLELAVTERRTSTADMTTEPQVSVQACHLNYEHLRHPNTALSRTVTQTLMMWHIQFQILSLLLMGYFNRNQVFSLHFPSFIFYCPKTSHFNKTL